MEAVAMQEIEESFDMKNTDKPEKYVDIQRKVIKEGTIRFETINSARTRKTILQNATEFKGYLSRDDIQKYGENTEYEITIRVPSENFEVLLESISQDAQNIDSKSIKALDVTEEFLDVEARIKTKKELEDRYKELLKRANTIDEILSIEREIGTLRTEIESIEGRLKYLKDRVTFSTLTVIFYENTSVNDSFGFSSKFINAIHDGWINILWFLITLTQIWPFLLIGVMVIVVIKRVKKKRLNRER
jgi:hypothetical protein